jgi:glucoamylase
MEALPFLSSFSALNLTSLTTQPIMYSLGSLILAGTVALQTVFCLPDPSRVKERDAEILKRSVDSFIATESPIALSDLLCNIGASGACASGADGGIVVASPDKTNPDCTVLPSQSRQGVANNFTYRFLYVDT